MPQYSCLDLKRKRIEFVLNLVINSCFDKNVTENMDNQYGWSFNPVDNSIKMNWGAQTDVASKIMKRKPPGTMLSACANLTVVKEIVVKSVLQTKGRVLITVIVLKRVHVKTHLILETMQGLVVNNRILRILKVIMNHW